MYEEPDKPKTKKTNREIELLPPVIEALIYRSKKNHNKTDYVSLDMNGNSLTPDPMREVV